MTHFPNSVWISNRPCWGRIKKSPSLLQKALFPIDVLAAYKCIARPSRSVGSPFPANVFRPSTKSTRSSSEGISMGCHASWVGLTWTLGFNGEKLDSNCAKRDIYWIYIQRYFVYMKFDTYIWVIWKLGKSLMSDSRSNSVKPAKVTVSHRTDVHVVRLTISYFRLLVQRKKCPSSVGQTYAVK